MADPTVTIGRIVHFVMPDGKSRPAQVVEVFTPPTVNLQVFTDGGNDRANWIKLLGYMPSPEADVPALLWRTSVGFDGSDKPVAGTWHWPPSA
jgi:hypothetical protein